MINPLPPRLENLDAFFYNEFMWYHMVPLGGNGLRLEMSLHKENCKKFDFPGFSV